MKIDLTGLEKVVVAQPAFRKGSRNLRKGVYVIGNPVSGDTWFEKLYDAKHFQQEYPLIKVEINEEYEYVKLIK